VRPALLLALMSVAMVGGAEPFEVALRTRSKDVAVREARSETGRIEPARTAAIVCDMWDTHTCPAAASRVVEMAPRMDRLLRELRRRGVLIIHCPSGTMKFYEGTPARKLAQAAPKATTRTPLEGWVKLIPEREGALPIDDSDGGCDVPRTWKPGDPYPWTRQIAAIDVLPGDAVTDSREAYDLMMAQGRDTAIIMGVHLNMCVLGRPFGIRQLVAQGVRTVLVRDLTDTMYNPAQAPRVSHFEGTRLMIEHVERHWCPTVASSEILGGTPFRFSGDR